MSNDARIESLKERHAGIEMQLHDEEVRPAPDTSALLKLKREKLRIKDEIARLRGSIH
jgi:hypothetical protein